MWEWLLLGARSLDLLLRRQCGRGDGDVLRKMNDVLMRSVSRSNVVNAFSLEAHPNVSAPSFHYLITENTELN
jgi:hypothetical protein